ncbi:VAC8 [Symbiodinium sp. KB8]|nr:VAC8 [Symbiodinium sp. KB8]
MASRLLMGLVKAGDCAKQALLEEPCAIPSLVEVLQKGTSNARSYSAAILRNLSDGSEARSKMVAQQEGAVKGLIGLVTAVINDAVSQRRATEALANLAMYSGIQVGREALGKLAQLRLSRDEDLAEAATEALENLGRHSANQDAVAQVNTVYANVQKLKSDMVSDAKAAAEALLNACEDEDDDILERLVIKLGGMTPVMKLLDGAAEEDAAGLLMLLVNVGDSVIRTLVEHPSAIPSLVRILRNGTAPAQADAAGVFRNASHLEACSKLMAEKGAIEGLVDLLRSPGPTRQRRAAGALANLASHSEELRAAVGKAGAIGPLVELKASDHDDVAEAAADALDNLGLNDANKEEIKASEKTAPDAEPEAEEPKKVADQVQEPAKEQPTSEASAKEVGYPTPVPCQSVGLPDGAGARLAMFSLRFDNGPIEAKFRRVHQLLKNHNFNVLMVDADAGDNFGTMTMDYWTSLLRTRGS